MNALSTLAARVLEAARRRGVTLAAAESCTGGNIAHSLTLVPGASDVVAGGVVAYCNEVKALLLGVSRADLARCGAVSIPVVRQMAAGACRATGARLGLATSGIAGPGGAVPGKPVGTVCLCVCLDGEVLYETAHFEGDRREVIDAATARALLMAAQLLEDVRAK